MFCLQSYIALCSEFRTDLCDNVDHGTIGTTKKELEHNSRVVQSCCVAWICVILDIRGADPVNEQSNPIVIRNFIACVNNIGFLHAVEILKRVSVILLDNEVDTYAAFKKRSKELPISEKDLAMLLSPVTVLLVKHFESDCTDITAFRGVFQFMKFPSKIILEREDLHVAMIRKYIATKGEQIPDFDLRHLEPLSCNTA